MSITITPYEVGRFYRVPVVRTRLKEREPDQDWPVLGGWHEDAEHIGFDRHHYHLDGRFLSKQQWRYVRSLWYREKADDLLAVFFLVVVHESKSPPALLRRKCRRVLPEYDHSIPKWMHKLNTAYRTKTIDQRLICPHRGASLEGLTPDASGCVTCPLHGLRWSCETGRLVSET